MKRGTPETFEVRLPTVPPSRRTVRYSFEFGFLAPFQVSSTAKDVKVQISPWSQAVEFVTQRARTTSGAACASCATDMRTNVVERASAPANNAARVSKIDGMIFPRIFVFSLISLRAFQ